MIRTIQLKPIRESTEEYDRLEARLKEHFKREIYFPLLKELGKPQGTLQNAPASPLVEALRTGKITFYRGVFSGKFDAGSSRELKRLGAKWDSRQGTFKIPLAQVPMELRPVIAASESQFNQKLDAIDRKLAQILPEEIAGSFKSADLFDKTLYKTETSFQESVKNITVTPKLTPEQRERIADEWQNNMKLWIQDFTKKEIPELRSKLQRSVFAGNRYGSAVKIISSSYDVSANKAKFLARQETGLLMAKFKETRYSDAGINEYTWHAVSGSKLHPVRPAHKALADARENGKPKVYRFDQPPNTAGPGEPPRHNNPGEDYNCRCYARPIVRFKTSEREKLQR